MAGGVREPTALIADRDPLSRWYIASLLGQHMLAACRYASSFSELLDGVGGPAAIDLIIVDFDLPAMSRDIGLKHLRSLAEGVKLVVVTTMDERSARHCACRVDADAFLSKHQSREDLGEQLQAIVADLGPGHEWPGTPCANKSPAPQRDLFGHELTGRQRDVLTLLAQGRTNREISEALAISEGTVKVHVNSAFRILGVHNRLSAAAAFSRTRPSDDGGDEDLLL